MHAAASRGARFPARNLVGRDFQARRLPKPRLGRVVRKRRKLPHERRIKRTLLVRAVSPPSVYLSRFILRTSHDASEEVSICFRAASDVLGWKQARFSSFALKMAV